MTIVSPARTQIISVTSGDLYFSRLKSIIGDYVSQISEQSFNDFMNRLGLDSNCIIFISSKIIKNNSKHWHDFISKIQKSHAQLIVLVEPTDLEAILEFEYIESIRYIKAPFKDTEIKHIIESAFLEMQNPTNQRQSIPACKLGSNKLIGQSEEMQRIYDEIEKAAKTDILTLITGETGTGKELAAQAIHDLSERHDKPYIPVNLGALPKELIASELFGYEKGAFTGATKLQQGKFEQADDGTILLDEIGSADLKVQVSLLRLIEQNTFFRLGGKEPVKNLSRIVVASNENLEEMVKDGEFREDLFYRLDVFRIHMPPLKDRIEDIRLLVTHFLKDLNQSLGVKIIGGTSEFFEKLESYNWPGNVRELRNAIQRAVVMCDGDVLDVNHLPKKLRDNSSLPTLLQFSLGTSLDEIEKRTVIRALEVSNNNRTKAARLLGISRRAIYNKIEKHHLDWSSD